MTSPFHQIAPQYARLWSDTSRGRAQREQVWRETKDLFHPGDHVLDLGCGTGDDAVHLMSRGVKVLGIDSEPAMVEIAQARGVDARQLAIEKVSSLDHLFDGVISNFGVLNCIANLGELSGDLSRLVRPRGMLALCVMSRFCWRVDWKHAVGRWSGHAVWRGIDVHYRTGRSIVQTFTPCFEFERRISIGNGDHQLLVFRRRREC